MRLTTQAAAAIKQAGCLVERDQAMASLAGLLDPGKTLSTWTLAGRVADRLRLFLSTAHDRIAAGHREPHNELERALMAVCVADCPTSQRRLFDLLAELGF